MKQKDLPRHPPHRHRLQRERVHDTYALRKKLPEPTRCPDCGAYYHNGRWTWTAASGPGGQPPTAHVCAACQRIKDAYPAGVVDISGGFAAAHRDEIIALARNIEQQEKQLHPMNRIMAIAEQDGELQITTTDVHLPHRIGHALRDAWEGELSMHYDDAGYFLAVEWHRAQ
jgi:NMD protein affecting ribosome stability and mRNA decay